MEGGGEGAPRQWVAKLGTAVNLIPVSDGRTENVGTFVYDHSTCGEKVGDLQLEVQDKIKNEF